MTAIYAACGPPAVGAVTAITNAGIAPEDIILVGFDALPDEVALIVAGTEDASVAQFPAKIGELGIDTLFKAVQRRDGGGVRGHRHRHRDRRERRRLRRLLNQDLQAPLRVG